ncbi:rifamycin-inactivating phosphotransferase [Actinocatenispora rupis]|uniref:Rifampicin phosphotransferase n=1 Tax=Actinocatenispora rupis TaxID=519421 RepID=A0A8J3J4S8_9ACTN|nr:rifamycin-inactivating phosphotransferase [Actinocatenispora rupis]GID14715.1 putative phosphoenolpyruvate synthase [Actinocatenispora rupis]
MGEQYVVGLREIDRTWIADAGGKGAQLGELTRIDGVLVPDGFCVTTAAFRRVVAEVPGIDERLDELACVAPDDRAAVRTLSAEIRRTIEDVAIPDDLAAAITDALAGLGSDTACAVRSSATAEDLPTASFAGQQDTYLNVVGVGEVLRHVGRCWASLFTERAVAYRQRAGIDHRAVHMAVVVQRMVVPEAAGILFTADPVTSNRKVASVEASYGLGEALVSGRVDPDVWTVRDDAIVTRTVGTKRFAIEAVPSGGTGDVPVDPGRRSRPSLTDAQVRQLVRLGRRIAARFGRPQDIEWCLTGDGFRIVQSRPITTLFPVPGTDDDTTHVYVSVGHQQMMTDAMTPLGLSFWQMTTPRPMAEAGGRLFVDVTPMLAAPASRTGLLDALGRSDPLIGDALRTLLDRGDVVAPVPDDGPAWTPPGGGAAKPVETDPAIVTDLIDTSRASLDAARRELRTKSGPDLFDAIRADIQKLRRIQSRPRSMQVIMAGMQAAWWLNDHLREWLGEPNVADTLTQSVPNNVTAEMGLALVDVADAIRPYPEVVGFLRDAGDDLVLARLADVEGGTVARQAIEGWLDRYGMRCVGEIDITRPRWAERPGMLVPLILGNIANFEPGAGARRFDEGRRAAEAKERDVLTRLRTLPGGEAKAAETRRMIDRVRTFSGYREHPKYHMISRYFLYKQALSGEAARLVDRGVLDSPDDAHFLRFDELHDVVRTGRVDRALIDRRRAEFASYQALTPPRVLTSDGEVVAGSYRRDDVPDGALAGLPVSAGTVEGRARVVLDMAQADLEPGDILVTTHTDPSWTPLFVAVAGLVTEVGGLMTHGAVIAREYGLPAVVGVVDATRLIVDGQRIRVHGTDGYVELLS